MNKMHLLATAAAGLESVVTKELKKLGYETSTENGRVRFEGTFEDIYKTNIWLRSSDRVKIIVAEFKSINTFDELFQAIQSIEWERFLDQHASFPVTARSIQSTLFSLSDIQSISKKAIVNRLQNAYNISGFLDETGAKFAIDVAFNKDEVLVTLDTTGDSLFKRGYRTQKGGAPLKENFAAALVLLTNWFTDNPFVDPVTGSGTIPIEAAMIGKNIAPGINRNFEFENWEIFDPEIANRIREEADGLAKYDEPIEIYGFDIDGSMIDIAKENARHVGLSNEISFKQLAAKDWITDEKNGVIVANPPYGERLGEQKEVRQLYHDMGDLYRPLKTWSKYILTSDEEFEVFFGQKATKKRKLYNGALKVDYYQYWGKKER